MRRQQEEAKKAKAIENAYTTPPVKVTAQEQYDPNMPLPSRLVTNSHHVWRLRVSTPWENWMQPAPNSAPCGVGACYHLNDSMGVEIEYTLLEEDYNYVTAAFNYYF